MNKRQKKVKKSLLKNEVQVLKTIENAYNEAIQGIDKVILELLSRKDTQNLQSIIYQVKWQEHIKEELKAYLDVLHEKNYTTIDEYQKDC